MQACVNLLSSFVWTGVRFPPSPHFLTLKNKTMKKKCIFTLQFEYDDSDEISQEFVDNFFTEDDVSSLANDPALISAGVTNVEVNFNVTDL